MRFPPLLLLPSALLVAPHPAPAATASVETVAAYHLADDERVAGAMFAEAGGDIEKLHALVKARADKRPNVRYIADTLVISRRLRRLGETRSRPELVAAAADLADLAVRTYQNPEGTFNEYDRCTWLRPDQLHRTVPWGTAFHGQAMLRALHDLGPALGESRRADWRERLRRTGAWIEGNPVLDRVVFNAAIDLCGLLWKIGDELGDESFKSSALASAHRLLDRHLDSAQGWIRGENSGVSGFYQQVGMEFVGDFARASGDPRLREALLLFTDTATRFATPTWQFPGNFGTRTPSLGPMRGAVLLQAAALGHPAAAAQVRAAGQSKWSDDDALWSAALATPPAPAATPRSVETFPAIAATTLRGGPWQAWFFNYEKSLWARGFSALWHARDDAWIFGTLQSLPAKVEKAKLRLGDTDDFAGFPRVRVVAGDKTYSSHQRIDELQAGGYTARWRETLRDRKGQAGGRLDATLTLGDPALTLDLRLADLAGPATLDFHFLRPAPLAPATEPVAASAQAGAKSTDPVTVRVGDATYRFRLLEAPGGTTLQAGLAAEKGLHTGNLGGLRVRLVLPDAARAATVRVACERP